MTSNKIAIQKVFGKKRLYDILNDYSYTVKYLYRKLNENPNCKDTQLIIPIIFLMRHSIEVGLKDSIEYFCHKSEINNLCGKNKNDKKKIKGHQLTRLYNAFNAHWLNLSKKYDLKNQNKHLSEICDETTLYIKELSELCNFFDTYDQGSISIRYAVSKPVSHKQNFKYLVNDIYGIDKDIDLTKLYDSYEKIIIMLKHLEDALYDFFEYINELENDMKHEMIEEQKNNLK